jgi:hypothetical protein
MVRIAFLVFIFATAAHAQAPLLPGSTKDQLSGDLRGLLLKNLPSPLYEAAPNWGHQSDAKRLEFRGKLRNLRLEMMPQPRNDGVWRKIKVEAIHPADTLVFDLRHLVKADDGRLAFQLFVALDVHFDIRQQRWMSGIKLLDTEIRGRTRVRITVDCEAKSRLDTANFLPDLVIQLKVVRANLEYENLKFEHIAGLGGEAAEIIGELGQTLIKQWKPSIERDLLAKANAAILKAGEQKEVRVSLAKLLNSAK